MTFPKEGFPEALLELTRDFNAALSREHYSLRALHSYASELAGEMYKASHHWHSYDGKCCKETPFELFMQAVALISANWVADIYLRKARDRDAPSMEGAYEVWRELLVGALGYTQKEIKESRDVDAEQKYQEVAKRPSRIKCVFNRWRWGH